MPRRDSMTIPVSACARQALSQGVRAAAAWMDHPMAAGSTVISAAGMVDVSPWASPSRLVILRKGNSRMAARITPSSTKASTNSPRSCHEREENLRRASGSDTHQAFTLQLGQKREHIGMDLFLRPLELCAQLPAEIIHNDGCLQQLPDAPPDGIQRNIVIAGHVQQHDFLIHRGGHDALGTNNASSCFNCHSNVLLCCIYVQTG